MAELEFDEYGNPEWLRFDMILDELRSVLPAKWRTWDGGSERGLLAAIT